MGKQFEGFTVKALKFSSVTGNTASNIPAKTYTKKELSSFRNRFCVGEGISMTQEEFSEEFGIPLDMLKRWEDNEDEDGDSAIH